MNVEPNGAPPPPPAEHALPQAAVRKHLGFSWIWLLPLGALGLVGYLLYTLLSEHGPTISITFQTADGLSAQQTPLKYKAVTLGVVERVELAKDLSHVVAKVRMSARGADLLTEKTRFWVVRPRLTGGLSGLQTGLEALVSGAYLAVDPGPPGGKPETDFKGLEEPPSTRSDDPGSVFYLESPALAGLSEGAPVYYREVNVGELLSYEIRDQNAPVRLRIFVHAPYDARINDGTRFWNSSGIRIETGGTGLKIELQSLKSVLSGGIAFGNPPGKEARPQSKPETTFQLYASEPEAEVGFYGPGTTYVSYFQNSVRGLGPGAQVSMFGKPVGTVTALDFVRDPRPNHQGQLAVRVRFVLEPERALSAADRALLEPDGVRALVRDQLRVVLASGSLLTGQQELSLEYVPGSKQAALTQEGETLVLPSEAQDLSGLTASLGQIMSKVNAIPFAEIGENANKALASLDRTVSGPELKRAIVSLDTTLKEAGDLARQAKTDLGPALARLPAISEKLEHTVDQAQAAFGESGYGSNSTTQRSLDRMMTQVADAARSIRLLADYLNRHPESVVSGRREGEP